MARLTKKERIGEHFKTKEELGNYEIVIVEYNNSENVLVQFQDEHKAIVPTTYRYCRRGSVPNPYHPSVFGVGYIGVGEYKTNKDEGRGHNECSIDWHNLLKRGFDKEWKEKHPTYKDIIINPEIYNFQNFAEWWYNSRYEIEGEVMCIDKDILIKGNKEYSFDKMIFVPKRINTLFTKRDNDRGDLPIGVYYNKANDKYIAQCSILTDDGQKRKHIGCYNNPEEAFQAYKIFKETYIKEVADEYKDKIPDRLYKAMYDWKVDIND